jgi:hypothetical protein
VTSPSGVSEEEYFSRLFPSRNQVNLSHYSPATSLWQILLTCRTKHSTERVFSTVSGTEKPRSAGQLLVTSQAYTKQVRPSPGAAGTRYSTQIPHNSIS